jgi:hypothetical protein
MIQLHFCQCGFKVIFMSTVDRNRQFIEADYGFQCSAGNLTIQPRNSKRNIQERPVHCQRRRALRLAIVSRTNPQQYSSIW